jgi:nitrogen fixation NifU-like protein
MSDELNELYQQVILDHSRKPRNFRALEEASCSAEGNNPLCGDHYTVFLRLDDGVIRDISFQGSGCAISKAAASIMTEQLKGKTAEEARRYFSQYQNMIKTGEADEEAMGKLIAFAGVHNFPMRVKCATLPWHAMLAGLEGKGSVSTDLP